MESNLQELRKYLKDYLQFIGINTREKVLCLSKEHQDTNPSMQYNPNNNTMHCWSCGCNLSIFDIVMTTNNCGFKDSIKIIEELVANGFIKQSLATFNKPPKKKENNLEGYRYSKECIKYISKTSYFSSRNITNATCEKVGVGYDPKKNNVIVPTNYPNLSYIYKNLNNGGKGYYFLKGGGTNLTVLGTVNDSNTYFITEGAFDGLSFVQENQNVICMNSANNKINLFALIEELIFLDDLCFVIALDNDDIGQERKEEIMNLLTKKNIKFKEFVIPRQYNDVNEYYCSDIANFKKNMEDYKMENNKLKDEILQSLKNVTESIDKSTNIDETKKIALAFMQELKVKTKTIIPKEYTGIVKSINDFENSNGSTTRKMWIETEEGKKLSLQKYCKDISNEENIELGDSITVNGNFKEFFDEKGKKTFYLKVSSLDNHTEKERNEEYER